jgi:hypothetical protein
MTGRPPAPPAAARSGGPCRSPAARAGRRRPAGPVRSLALLKLYFGYFAQPADLAALAAAQRQTFAGLMRHGDEMVARLRTRHDRRWQLEVVEFFRAFTVTLIERWEQVEAAASRERRAPD